MQFPRPEAKAGGRIVRLYPAHSSYERSAVQRGPDGRGLRRPRPRRRLDRARRAAHPVRDDRDGEGRALQRFVADDFRDAVEQARGSLRDTDADIAAIAYEAFVNIDGERADAVIVEFYERGGAHSGLLGQRFQPGDETTALERVGNPAFLGEQDRSSRAARHSSPSRTVPGPRRPRPSAAPRTRRLSRCSCGTCRRAPASPASPPRTDAQPLHDRRAREPRDVHDVRAGEHHPRGSLRSSNHYAEDPGRRRVARALELDEPPSLRLCDAPPAVLAPRGIRVKALLSGVSHGTELSCTAERRRSPTASSTAGCARSSCRHAERDYPATLGYELVGQVEEAGEDVHETSPTPWTRTVGSTRTREAVKVGLHYDGGER